MFGGEHDVGSPEHSVWAGREDLDFDPVRPVLARARSGEQGEAQLRAPSAPALSSSRWAFRVLPDQSSHVREMVEQPLGVFGDT